jgi:hypothetical protein
LGSRRYYFQDLSHHLAEHHGSLRPKDYFYGIVKQLGEDELGDREQCW